MKRLVLLIIVVISFMNFSNIAYAASPRVSNPVTENPIVLGADRAILLGTCNGTGSERGFFYGTVILDNKIVSRPIERGKMNVLVVGLQAETTYYIQAYVRSGRTIYVGEIVQFTTPSAKEFTIQDAVLQTSDERYNYIFGTTNKCYKVSAPPWGFNGAVEARKHMVTISVPIWKLSHSKKVANHMNLTINYKLKASVQAIFGEIYALDIKLPIAYLSGYSYRRMLVPWIRNNPYLSQHSFGTCIDINRYQNRFYHRVDRRNTRSPYYIPRSVIEIFEKYGWTWGGNFKEGKDTMHFQYLGPELMQ